MLATSRTGAQQGAPGPGSTTSTLGKLESRGPLRAACWDMATVGPVVDKLHVRRKATTSRNDQGRQQQESVMKPWSGEVGHGRPISGYTASGRLEGLLPEWPLISVEWSGQQLRWGGGACSFLQTPAVHIVLALGP